MSLACVYSRAQIGIEAPQVTVEVHITQGLPSFSIVGLPETSVKEAKDRVRSALLNSHYQFPQQRITVNLAPADLPKQGGRFDLAIAIGILLASKQLPEAVQQQLQQNHSEFYGELALSGELLGHTGILPALLAAKSNNSVCYISHANHAEASLISKLVIKASNSLAQVCGDLLGQISLPLVEPVDVLNQIPECELDLAEVKGQQHGKRALEIAAAGQHNLLFVGPPGTGKSMLAARMATILPPLNEAEALSTAAVYSLTGHKLNTSSWRQRPFRSPHHTCSAVALVGGSSQVKPGEISLAHNGVLFLDELTEFDRKVLDSLREPMETRKVMVSRAARQCEYPANFQLICALNPSPTGSIYDKRATPDQILRYLNKISGPFLDRIDLQVELNNVPTHELQQLADGEPSYVVQQRVILAQQHQYQRQGKLNAQLANRELMEVAKLGQSELALLAKLSEHLALSPRSYHRLIKVALTIADIAQHGKVEGEHIKEAISYRAFERLLGQLTRL
jgi:magnesium chelatase family protein